MKADPATLAGLVLLTVLEAVIDVDDELVCATS